MINLFKVKKKVSKNSSKNNRDYEKERERLAWSELYIDDSSKSKDKTDKNEK